MFPSFVSFFKSNYTKIRLKKNNEETSLIDLDNEPKISDEESEVTKDEQVNIESLIKEGNKPFISNTEKETCLWKIIDFLKYNDVKPKDRKRLLNSLKVNFKVSKIRSSIIVKGFFEREDPLKNEFRKNIYDKIQESANEFNFKEFHFGDDIIIVNYRSEFIYLTSKELDDKVKEITANAGLYTEKFKDGKEAFNTAKDVENRFWKLMHDLRLYNFSDIHIVKCLGSFGFGDISFFRKNIYTYNFPSIFLHYNDTEISTYRSVVYNMVINKNVFKIRFGKNIQVHVKYDLTLDINKDILMDELFLENKNLKDEDTIDEKKFEQHVWNIIKTNRLYKISSLKTNNLFNGLLNFHHRNILFNYSILTFTFSKRLVYENNPSYFRLRENTYEDFKMNIVDSKTYSFVFSGKNEIRIRYE